MSCSVSAFVSVQQELATLLVQAGRDNMEMLVVRVKVKLKHFQLLPQQGPGSGCYRPCPVAVAASQTPLKSYGIRLKQEKLAISWPDFRVKQRSVFNMNSF